MVLFFLPYSIRTLIASLTFLCCNVFAAYHSFKAIHHKQLNTSSHWLFYWTLVACLVIAHSNPLIHDALHTLIPLYPEIRIAIHLLTLYYPVRCLSYVARWIGFALETLRVRYFLTYGAILFVRALRNMVKMGVLDDGDDKLLEQLKNVTNEAGFAIAVVSNNRKRASLQQHSHAIDRLTRSVHMPTTSSSDDDLVLDGEGVPSVKGRITMY